MNPHARSVNTFRQQFRWQRRSHCLWLIRAFAGSTIPLASDDATPGHRFDFDLFAVFMLPQSLQRQTTASTDFGVVRNIDFLNACGKVRVISALRSRICWLLPSFLLRGGLLVWIIEPIRTIAGGLLFCFLTEALCFELSDFGLRFFQFRLQLRVSLDRPSMHTAPVADLTTQLDILCTQLPDFTTQLFHQSP